MTEYITPEDALSAYAAGIFPMSDSAHDPEIFWVEPRQRGIIPLDGLHISRRLARTVKSDLYEVTIDKDFEQLIDACAAPAEDRQDTWINQPIRNLFLELHGLGVAHSVECWRDGELAGGLYGMALAGAFFGESMVSLQRDASKVALVHLVARLITGGYTLLDTQFTTPHLESLGCVEVSREDYQQRLAKALENQGRFGALPASISGVEALQSITQTS